MATDMDIGAIFRPADANALTVLCTKCRKEQRIEITAEQYTIWNRQGIPPNHLSEDEKHLMVTGVCVACFKPLLTV